MANKLRITRIGFARHAKDVETVPLFVQRRFDTARQPGWPARSRQRGATRPKGNST